MMKLMKKLASLLLALVMVLGLTTTAFADTTGTITIDNAVNGKTYTIYRIFDLNDHNEGYTALNYKVSTKWEDFFTGEAAGLTYVDIDSQGYVTWKADKKTDAEIANFAAAAKAFAKANSIVSDGQQTAASGTVTFTGLELGYYLVETDLGALCSLNTTTPAVTIKEKNGAPTVKKEVQEGSSWGEKNDANIGDTVNFKATINVVDGNPRDYVLHDTMSAGLTFQSSSVVVKVGDSTILTADTQYTLVTTGLNDGCTFEIRFAEGVLKPNDVVTVTYSATLNKDAIVAGTGNPNTVKLSYKDDAQPSGTNETEESKTYTYTWAIDVFKYTGTEKTPLSGAEFVLLNSDKTMVATVENGKVTGWAAVPADGKTWAANTVLTSGADGKIALSGLDTGTYFLKEIKAPAGYNLLEKPIQVNITASYNDTNKTGTSTVNYGEEGQALTGTGTIEVENKTGTTLPSTGGMGTTLFYIVGGALVIGAAVLLITRKRMGQRD